MLSAALRSLQAHITNDVRRSVKAERIMIDVKEKKMKKDIHPDYQLQEIKCSCGNVIKTKSTARNLTVEICSACHPFFTGTQKLVDSTGRVERFNKRYGKKN